MPKICRTKRLLHLAQDRHTATTDITQNQEIVLHPTCALAQAACVPTLLGAPLNTHKTSKSDEFSPFALSRRTRIPLYVLHDAPGGEPWFNEFETYLDEGAKSKVLHMIDHPFDIPAITLHDKIPYPCALVGTSDATALWGALGLLGLKCTVDEMDSILDDTPLTLSCPQVIGVELTGGLPVFGDALDIAYHLAHQFASRYGPNKIVEFYGSSLDQISLEMRQEICLQSRFMDALGVIWPADSETLRGVQSKQRFKSMTQQLGLWHSDDESFDYDDTLTINLSALKPGYPLSLTPPAPLTLDTTTWAPPYVPPTNTHPANVLPVTRAVVVLGAHSKVPDESVLALSILLENAVQKKLYFKVPTTFFIHKDHLVSSDIISQMCEHILTLKGSFELHNLPFGTHVVTSDGATLLTSRAFACVYALIGSTYLQDLPDLNPTITLKDIWPSLDAIRARASATPLPPVSKTSTPATKTRPFWQHIDQKSVLAADIEDARPLPILRNHDLTFSLLSRGPIPSQNDEPFEAYRSNPHFLTLEAKQVIKRYVPKICESYLEDDCPLVLFGGHDYGRGGDWAWFERALALVHVRAVVAYSFDPTIHRAFLTKGIVPLHWMAPMTADHIMLDGRERISITGINAAFTPNHVVTMSVTQGSQTFFAPLMLRDPLYPEAIRNVG